MARSNHRLGAQKYIYMNCISRTMPIILFDKFDKNDDGFPWFPVPARSVLASSSNAAPQVALSLTHLIPEHRRCGDIGSLRGIPAMAHSTSYKLSNELPWTHLISGSQANLSDHLISAETSTTFQEAVDTSQGPWR